MVWNLKEGWEPLCKFLNVPIPDVPVPRENVTGDLGWGKEYFYQDQVTRNGFIYLICNSILIILAICLAIYLPFKYVWWVPLSPILGPSKNKFFVIFWLKSFISRAKSRKQHALNYVSWIFYLRHFQLLLFQQANWSLISLHDSIFSALK